MLLTVSKPNYSHVFQIQIFNIHFHSLLGWKGPSEPTSLAFHFLKEYIEPERVKVTF